MSGREVPLYTVTMEIVISYLVPFSASLNMGLFFVVMTSTLIYSFNEYLFSSYYKGTRDKVVEKKDESHCPHEAHIERRGQTEKRDT